MSSNVIKKIKLPNNVTYDIGGGVPTFTGTEAEWNALTSAQKAEYEIVNLTDDYDINVELDDAKTTTTNVWSASKVNTELSGKANASALPVWTSGVAALTSATSCTITNDAISSTSVLEVFYENTSGTDPVAKVTGVSSHTATIEFSALAEDTTFYLRVTNL